MKHKLMLNNEEIMKGDERSIKVIFYNLNGRNFNGVFRHEYRQYLQQMNYMLDVAFNGALELVDASGKTIDSFLFLPSMYENGVKDERPWAINTVDWVALAEKGQLRRDFGMDLPGEETARTLFKLGEIHRYPIEDIAHFYGRRRGLFNPANPVPSMELEERVEMAHREYIEDAITEGKNVPEWLREKLGL